jgi:peptidoglycan/LPS O-acetylase OafA/YrhL
MSQRTWPGLDGLRGVAVIAVVAYHAAQAQVPNGYVGVDVFFALSGFLITGLLLREVRDTGRSSLRSFYLRRATRLYPALVVVCAGVAGLGFVAGDAPHTLRGVVAALTYTSNWWIYTGHAAVLLDHTWTLALEEHFYLVWPVLLLLLTAASRRRRVVGVVALVSVAVVLLIPWTPGLDGVRIAYLRAAPMVWGCALAFAVHSVRFRRRPSRALAWLSLASLVGLALLVVSPVAAGTDWTTGVRSVPGLLSVAVVAGVVVSPGSVTARIVSWAPLLWLGRRSYGIYLYHFPLTSIALNQVTSPGSPVLRGALAAVGSVAVAAESYAWLERPVLRAARRSGRHDQPVAVAASEP